MRFENSASNMLYVVHSFAEERGWESGLEASTADETSSSGFSQ